MITKKQIKIIHTLYGRLKLDSDTRRELVQQYSNGRANSSTGLTYPEAAQMIRDLNLSTPDGQKADRQRKLIIHYARQMGWEVDGKADMGRLEAWCKKFGYLHKGLNQYTPQELPRLVTQFEAVYKSFLKSL